MQVPTSHRHGPVDKRLGLRREFLELLMSSLVNSSRSAASRSA